MKQGTQDAVAPIWFPDRVSRAARDRDYEARIAVDEKTLRDAYQLRYRSYYSQGHIAHDPSGLFRDEYDNLPTATTVVVYAQGRPAGSVRTCLLRRGPGTTSPARHAYRDEVNAVLDGCEPEGTGYDGVEVNRLVRAPEAADDQGLVFMLLRLAGRLGMAAGFKVAISCVRAHHLPFYRRMQFTEVGPMKVYPGLTCPMALLKLPRPDWDATRKAFRLMDPEAGPPGLLDGLEHGRTVRPQLVPRR